MFCSACHCISVQADSYLMSVRWGSMAAYLLDLFTENQTKEKRNISHIYSKSILSVHSSHVNAGLPLMLTAKPVAHWTLTLIPSPPVSKNEDGLLIVPQSGSPSKVWVDGSLHLLLGFSGGRELARRPAFGFLVPHFPFPKHTHGYRRNMR
jgi:hypothetical protein